MLKRFYSTNLTKEQYSSLSLLLTEVISPALLAIEINKLELTQVSMVDWLISSSGRKKDLIFR